MLDFAFEFWEKLTTVHKALAGIALLVVIYYAYGWYQARGNAQQQQLPQADDTAENYGDGDLVCTMYYVNWCKFCKKAKPEWEKLENEYNEKTVNGKKILIVKIDCEKNPELAESENVKAYPTFKFNLKNKYYDYPDEPVFQKFKTFVEYLVGLQE